MALDLMKSSVQLVMVAVDKYRQVGLRVTMAYFASPESALAGPEAAVDYYKAAETWTGSGSPSSGPGGEDSGPLGYHEDRRGHPGHVRRGAAPCPRGRGWLESESLRVFVPGTDAHTFGSGWHRHEPGN